MAISDILVYADPQQPPPNASTSLFGWRTALRPI